MPVERSRCYGTPALVTALTPPAVFVGLVLALWAYKCLMMVVFQDKIIYMPSVPPFSRRETLCTYQKACGRVQWREEQIESTDGTRLAICVAQVASAAAPAPQHLIVLYFQG